MTTAMGPPPPRTTAAATTTASEAAQFEENLTTSTTTMKAPMGPPPSATAVAEAAVSGTEPKPVEEILTSTTTTEKVPKGLPPSATAGAEAAVSGAELKPVEESLTSTLTTVKTPMGPPPPLPPPQNPKVPYTIPEWNGPPCHKYYLEVLKDGSIIDKFDAYDKGAYMFGRIDLCDFVLEHPTISRYHAVLQFKRNGNAFLYDLGSTHGTFINKSQVEKRIYVELHVGDVIRFGQSSRLYIFQGPPELMPLEVDKKIARDAKVQQMILDKEASLRRARREASLADGISWGMGEDAIEDIEDDDDEVTWQTYKGQLTEKQEKTREKVLKRTQKIAHMKKEIDAIRAKDISQGGLTQGQQTQIARNEQRISQLLEELDNLEETLNESIRESIGARSGRINCGKNKRTEEDDETLSDDDEFYDRTKKAPAKNAHETQSVETADSLLDKRDAIMKEMEEKKELLSQEKNKLASETATEPENGDSLDAFMTDVSSQLVIDTTAQIEKELSTLQSELDRIVFLLKIADPSGEAVKKRNSKAQQQTSNVEAPGVASKMPPPVDLKKNEESEKPIDMSTQKAKAADASVAAPKSDTKPKAEEVVVDSSGGKSKVYTVVKPQWLGAVEGMKAEDAQQHEVVPNTTDGSDQFVDYKNRQKIRDNDGGAQLKPESSIESAAPGLIVRKRKEVESRSRGGESNEQPSSLRAEFRAEDAVALLLKHKRGYVAEDEEATNGSEETVNRNQPNKDNKKAKRVLGPEKPSFLKTESDYESWVPPQGQSGDGRTSLNDRYGY